MVQHTYRHVGVVQDVSIVSYGRWPLFKFHLSVELLLNRWQPIKDIAEVHRFYKVAVAELISFTLIGYQRPVLV